MEKIDIAMRIRAKNDAPTCGDAVNFWISEKIIMLMITDGLGHGPEAAKASLTIIDFIGAHWKKPMTELFRECDLTVRHTRGAALGMARIEKQHNLMLYAGIGNSRAVVTGSENTRLDSDPGIIGGGFRRVNIDSVPLKPGDLVFMYTDGLFDLPNPASYGRFLYGDLDCLADRVFRECYRGTDDGALLIYRY